MSNFDSDGSFESEWNDRGDLAWNEFDWERYLREQEEIINRYLAFYESLARQAERIDEVARHMCWDDSCWDAQDATSDDTASPPEISDEYGTESEVYTLHKNPIFVATKALYLRVRRKWELEADDPRRVPQNLALGYLSSLHYGEDQAVQAIHALEFGDYAMAISLFKRALDALNRTLALLNTSAASKLHFVASYREDVLESLFDLREIWLRVINECRSELEHPSDDDE